MSTTDPTKSHPVAPKKKGLLDKLPPQARHGVILVAGALFSWGAERVTRLPQPIPEVAGVLLPMIALYLSKLTTQYGFKK